MPEPTSGLVSLLGKRKLPRGEIEEQEGSCRESKRPKICVRTVIEGLSKWRIFAENLVSFTDNARIEGGSADIVRAEAVIDLPLGQEGGENQDATTLHSVAVKKFRLADNIDDGRVKATWFTHELGLLSELCHKNIVKLIGFVENIEEGIAWILLRWESNGNVREFIQLQNWVIPERLSLIYDVACGLEYLHSRDPPICHGDLKSLNILVTSQNKAIITDFGCARKLTNYPRRQKEITAVGRARQAEPTSQAAERESPVVSLAECGTLITLTGPVYTLRWAAPELLNELPSSLASDMWAFAWICWEIMTGKVPFDELSKESHIIVRVTEGNLPTVASHKEISQVRALCMFMSRCWDMRPDARPTVEQFEGSIYTMDVIVPSRREDTEPEKYSTELLCSLGYTKRKSHKYEEAKDYFGSALNIARSAGNAAATATAMLALGTVYRGEGKYLEAQRWITEAKEVYSHLGDESKIADAVWHLGSIYYFCGEHLKAEAMYNQAKEVHTRLGNDYGVACAAQSLGNVYRVLGQYSKADTCYNEAKDMSVRVGDDLGVAAAFWELGQVYTFQTQHSKAKASYTKAKEICARFGDEKGVADATKQLGYVHYRCGEYPVAEDMYKEAKEIYKRLGEEQHFANAAWWLAEIYRPQGRYSDSESMYREAEGIWERLGDDYGIVDAVYGLGKVYDVLREYSKAEASYTKAKEIRARLGDEHGVADATQQLGYIHLLRDKYSAAEAKYSEAKEIYQRLGDQEGIADAAWWLGHIYRLWGKYSSAEAMYSEAKEICERLGDEQGVADAVVGWGQVYHIQNKYSKAKALLTKAKELCERLGDEEKIEDVVRWLGEVSSSPDKDSQSSIDKS